jgi:small subunit ribosomal protein S6
MRNYEVAFIVHPELNEAALAELVAKAQGWVTAAGGQVVQTDTVRPPILPHPVSAEPVLFHQLFLFHPQGLEAETRRSLAALFPEAEFPRAITHEGGWVAPATFHRLFDRMSRLRRMRRGDTLAMTTWW